MKQPPDPNLVWPYADPVFKTRTLQTALFLRDRSSHEVINRLRACGVTITVMGMFDESPFLDIQAPPGWEIQRGVHGAMFIVDAKGYTKAFFTYTESFGYKGLVMRTQWFWVGAES